MNTEKTVKIIGAGLAGSEAAWYLAERGVNVTIYEMRPEKSTNAHKTGLCAELVCSNSLKSFEITNACGLLKKEMELFDSIMVKASKVSQVPAGHALAVDRNVFAKSVDDTLRNHPKITFVNQEITSLPEYSAENPLIIASGPLTSPSLFDEIKKITGSEHLAFFDAIAPIFYLESLDTSVLYKKSRYDKGEAAYWNVPFNEEEYLAFVNAINAAEKYGGNVDVEGELEGELRPFEGCMPIEDMIARGINTPRFGPLKPKGLRHPETLITPYAALQLRQDDLAGNIWSMVGMQTRMKRHEQDKILRSLPGFSKAEFVRYGSFHRNTFINSPKCLEPTLESKKHKGLFFAGQLTGVEGYVESAMGGILASFNAFKRINKQETQSLPIETAAGSLFNYITEENRKDFQPMNISFGVMPNYFKISDEMGRKADKKLKKIKTAEASIASLEQFLSS